MPGLGVKRSILDTSAQKPAPGGTLKYGTGLGSGGSKTSGGGAGGFKLPPLLGGTGSGSTGNAPGVTIDPKTGKIVKTGGSPGGTFAGPSLESYAQKDPRIERTADALTKRRKLLETQEGQQDPFLMESVENLRQRMSADPTQRAIDRASSGAADWAAGMKERGMQAGSRYGRGADYGSSGIEAAAQRLQAKQASDISLGRERDLDQLAIAGHQILRDPSQYGLAKQGLTQGAYGQEAGFAPTGANLGLAQQRLGLDQWSTAADVGYKNALLQQQQQQGQIDLYLKMLAAAGY